jgi:hypothetical protein
MPVLRYNTTSSRNAFFDIARGIRSDCESVHLFGINTTIGTDFETLYDNGGSIYTFPTEQDTLTLASTSGDDTMQVRITGLNDQWREISEVVTLNGTNDVETTSEFFRINDARILGGNNVGDISIDHGANTVAYIQAEKGVHQAIIYSTPAGHSLYICTVKFDGTIGLFGTMRFRAMLQDPASDDLVWHFWDSIARTDLDFDLKIPFKVPEKRDFSIEARGTQGTNQIACYLSGVLMED